jgi:hypothetical protein
MTHVDINSITFNEQTTNTVSVSYQHHNSSNCIHKGYFIDDSVHGGKFEYVVQGLVQTMNHVDISFIADYSGTDLSIFKSVGVHTSPQVLVLVISHQYAHLGYGTTSHSTNQMKKFAIDVCGIPRTLIFEAYSSS